MANDTFRTYYLSDTPLEGSLVRDLIRECLDIGCTTTQDGRTDVCKYVSPDTGVTGTTGKTAVAVDSLAAAGEGRIELWYEDLRLNFALNRGSPYVPDVPYFSLVVWSNQFESYGDDADAEIRERVRQFLDVARPLAELADPTYAYGFVEKYEPEDVRPTENDIEAGNVEDVFWLNVLSAPTVTRFGGKRLLSAPAWKVEKLSNGSVFLVVNDSPWYCKAEADEIEEFLGIQ